MSWWNRIVAMVRRDDPLRYVQVIPLDNPAGVTISADNVFQLSVVWACVSAISNALAVCQWNVRQVQNKKWVYQPDDPLYYTLNTRPNEDMTAISFRECMMYNVLTWGNAYAEIVRDRAGRVYSLWPLLPHRVIPLRDWETNVLYYLYYQQDGGMVRLEQEDMFHLKGPGITGLMGDNLVARAAKSFSLAAAQERFAATYFGNNTIIGGYLKYPKVMDDRTFNHLRETWKDRHQGPDKAHKPAILEGGAEWVPFTNNASEAQLTDSRKFTVEEICRWYGVPPHKVQHLDRSTYNNIEQQALEFIRDACTPWARRWEQEVDFKLLGTRQPTRTMLIDMAPLTQGDFKTRMEGYGLARQWGIYSTNEIREKEGDNPIGAEGDVRMVPMNMQNAERLLDAPINDNDVKMGIPTVNEVRKNRGLPAKPNGDMPANQIPPNQAAPSHSDVEKPPPPKIAAPPGAGEGESAPQEQSKTLGAVEEKPKRKVDVLSESVATMFFGAIEHYGRKLANRAIDLKRRNWAGKKFDTHMAEERQRQRPILLRDCSAAIALVYKLRGQDDSLKVENELLLALDQFDNGASPLAVAESLTRKLLAAPEEAVTCTP